MDAPLRFIYNNRQKMGLNREMHEPMTHIMQLRLYVAYVVYDIKMRL